MACRINLQTHMWGCKQQNRMNLNQPGKASSNGDALPKRTYEVPFCVMSADEELWEGYSSLCTLTRKKTWGHVSFLCEPSIDNRELLANVLYDFNSCFKFSSTSYLLPDLHLLPFGPRVRCPLCTRNQLRKYAEEQNLHRQRGDIEPGHCHVGHQLSWQAMWCRSYESRSTKQIMKTHTTHT